MNEFEFNKCYYCVYYNDDEGCKQPNCFMYDKFKPDKIGLIKKAKEKGMSVSDLIALITFE